MIDASGEDVDVEALLVAWAKGLWLDYWPTTETPGGAEFAAAVVKGLVRFTRVGGPQTDSLDKPRVVVDSFGADRRTASRVARTVNRAMNWQLPGSVVGPGVVSRVETLSGPSWAPWDNTGVRRFTAVYQLHVKLL